MVDCSARSKINPVLEVEGSLEKLTVLQVLQALQCFQVLENRIRSRRAKIKQSRSYQTQRKISKKIQNYFQGPSLPVLQATQILSLLPKSQKKQRTSGLKEAFLQRLSLELQSKFPKKQRASQQLKLTRLFPRNLCLENPQTVIKYLRRALSFHRKNKKVHPWVPCSG